MLERSTQLAALTDSFAQVRDSSHGRLVLGEASAEAVRLGLVER
jgi:hypothetical protein